ncbi:MAG: peptidoglycan DD-metalloendopeptidase family protein [Armatimonadetes bacterium]|nr:peptidoglycan DD-metalloendopeptidase family protein [Armatimonadota bacterium]
MRTVLSIVAFATLALGIVAQDAAQNKDAVQSKDKLNDSLDYVKQQRDEIKDQIKEVDRDRAVVKRDIRSADRNLTRVSSQLERTENRLDDSVDRRNELADELDLASEQLDDRKHKVEDRLRHMYRQSEHSVLTMLAGAQSVGDLGSRRTLLERIAKHDKELFEGLQEIRADIEQKKREQESVIANISRLKSEQESRQGVLEQFQGEKRQILRGLERQKRDLAKEYAAWDRQSQDLQAQISDYQNRLAGTAAELKFGGSMIMPAIGPYTSPYGTRYHPILKRRRPHNGVDIGAKNRTAIVAAASGIVITAGWKSGFGNTVVIDHGGGVSSLYAHCSVISVRAGQKVNMGERIASVGSTGLATGPHLHFEVRLNGRPVNPRRYLP